MGNASSTTLTETWDAQARKRSDSPRSRLRRSVRLSPSSTPTPPAPSTSVSSRPPCAPLASRSRTRSSRRWSPTLIDGNGTIEFSEFLTMMTGKMGEKDSREDIEKVFKLFDDDNTNKISFRNLARVAEELGENIDD